MNDSNRDPSAPCIRRATADDAKPLAVLAERTFRDTFAAANTAEDMDAYCGANFGEAIQARELADPELDTFVVEQGGDWTGFLQLGWGAAPPCVVAARPVEIRRIYVVAGWQGRGIAQALMATALDRGREGGADRVWLGVWERNPRAIAFYRKLGFVEVGDHLFQLGSDTQRDLVLVRDPS